MKIHDISVPITPTMPTFPGDPPVSVERVHSIAQGAVANVSRIAFGDHTGTHVDPPLHFVEGGASVDQLDLRALYGPARVVDLTRVENLITAADLARARVPKRAVRILCKTRNSALWDQPGFQKDFIAFAPDAARWLVARGVKLVAIDYLSVEAFGAARCEAHLTLLGAGVVILEGVNLTNIASGDYLLACLPLKIQGGDGAPARAILIEA